MVSRITNVHKCLSQSINFILNIILFVKMSKICLQIQICKSYKNNIWARCGLGSKYVLYLHTAKTLKTYVCTISISTFLLPHFLSYRTRAIITRGLYIFYPLFEGQKPFLRGFFHKILALCMVSIQERFLIKSGL